MGWRNFNYIIGAMLLGWCGVAQAQQAGMDAELSYIGEEVWNVKGGIKKGKSYLGTGDMTVNIDTEQSGWWQGGGLFIEALINHGRDPSSFVGDIQTLSNIADGNRTRLQQLWFEQAVGEYLSILVGLQDMNSEFYVSDYASLFLNSSFGIGPEISANIPTSIWPEAGWATRLAVENKHFYVRIAAYDGNPATRALRAGREGVMWIAESGLHRGASAYKIGVWHHTGPKTAPDGRLFHADSGAYALVDQSITSNAGVFLQLGYAQPERNDIASYVGFGIHLDGVVPGRRQDQFGVAVARAAFSRVNRQVNTLTTAETSLEITYDMAMTDWLSIHPAVQWVFHPGGDSKLATAHVMMLRVELALP